MKKTLADYWAPRINTEWRKSVEGILNVGRQLVAAKEACEHGEFLRLFKGHENAVSEPVPFGESVAERLMKVASHSVISDSAHAPNLPQSWMTLYELTKLDDEQIVAGIKAGEITPDMTRSQAAALRADPIERNESAYWKALREIENAVIKHERQLSFGDRMAIVLQIRRLADHVEYGLTNPTPGVGRLDETVIERLRAAEVVPDDASVEEVANRFLKNGFAILARVLSEEQNKPASAGIESPSGCKPEGGVTVACVTAR